VNEYELTCIVEIPRAAATSTSTTPSSARSSSTASISASVIYPTDYGYVPETLAPDGEPLDVLVCVSEPTFPGCYVITKAVGLFKMSDEKGPDDHVVCVPCGDPGWNTIDDVDDLPALLRAEISHSLRGLQGPRPP